MSVDDPFARYFYEQECIKCVWSVRELRRQISTNLYVRTGISKNPEKMLSLPNVQGHDSNELQIRQPFTFEFLGFAKDAVVKELSIPIPAVIGQKKWREDRTANINTAIEALVSSIIALATKNGISLNNRTGIESATTQFLNGCDWSGMTEYRSDCCRSWTNQPFHHK